MPILFKPQPVTGRVRITMDGTRYDMTRFIKDRSDISAEWDVAANVVTATCKLTVPLTEDIYHLEAWQDFYWDSPPLTGGVYDRHIRGLIADVDSDPRTPNKIYTLKVTGGNVLLTKPPSLYVTPTTFDFQTATTDKQIVQAILTHCYPVGSPDRIYDDGVNSHYTFHNTPPLTFMGMNPAQALKHLQDYIATNATPGSQIPTYFVTWRRDDVTAGDNDDWSWVLEWYTESEIGTAAIELSDQLNEDSTHAHYYGFKRHRAGIQVVNRQVAIGKDPVTHEPITYTANDTDSQTYFGRIISAPPLINDQWTTLAAVQGGAQAELTKWRDIQETLSVGPVFIPFILNAPQKVNFTRAAEGGLSTPTPFALARVTLAYNAAGTPEYQLELGTSFPELGERGPGWRGGTNYNTGRSQPSVPTWHAVPADDVLDNTYHGNTGSDSTALTWVPNPEDNILDYYVKYSIDGAGEIFYPTTIPVSGQPTFTLTGLPPSSPAHSYTLAVSVRARNTWGYVSATWGAWRTITLAARDTPSPPTALTSTGQGPDSGGLYWLDLAWTVPAALPDHYGLRYVPHGGSYHQTRFLDIPALDRAGDPVTTVRVRSLLPINMDYALHSVTRYGDPGDEGTVYTHPIPPNIAPVPPPIKPPPADSTEDNPVDGWDQITGTSKVHVDPTRDYSGPALVLQPDDTDPVGLFTKLISAKPGEPIILKAAYQSADFLSVDVRLYRYDSDQAVIDHADIVDADTTTGAIQEIKWESPPLDSDTAYVALYVRAYDATGPSTLAWWLVDWRVRAEDIDVGNLRTAAKHQYETDLDHPMTTKLLGDGTRPVEERGDQYVSPPTGDAMDPGPARWAFQAKRGDFYGDLRDDTTLGFLDTLGNNTTTSTAGITFSSIGQIRLAGLLALQPTRITGAHTLAAPEGLIFAEMGSDYTLTLPSVVGIDGALVPICAWRSGLGVHTLTLQPDGTELIEGLADLEIDAPSWVILVADATAGRWHKLDNSAGGGSADPSTFILSGLSSSLPAAGTEGRLYYVTDTAEIYRDNGSFWDKWRLGDIDEPTDTARVVVDSDGLRMAGHISTEIIGHHDPPVLSFGPALGDGGHGTAPILDIAGTDTNGRITVTVGDGAIGDDVLFTLTYDTPYPDYPVEPPNVFLQPRNENAWKMIPVEGIYFGVDLGVSDRYQFTVKVTGPAMSVGVAYTFDYLVWGFPAP